MLGVSDARRLDARRLEVCEQARAQWGDGPAETLMELVVPAGQDMATRQDVERSVASLRADMEVRFARLEERISGLASKEYVLRVLVIGLLPVYAMLIGLLFGMYGS
jgi:hypothetical protein